MKAQAVHATLLALLAAAPLASSSAPASAQQAKPVYAMHFSVVAANEERVSYIYLSSTLDVPSKIPVEASRAFDGYANSRQAAGKVLVSDVGAVVNRFSISDDLEWQSAGPSLSFASYGIEDVGFWRQWFQSDTLAQVSDDAVGRILWNPTTFTIIEHKKTSKIPLTRPGGWEVGFSTNRLPSPESWKGPLVRPYVYFREDGDDWRSSDDSLMVVYDAQTQEEKSIETVPCADLQIPSQDEQGNTYYSSWGVTAVHALYEHRPKPCVARFKPDGSYDASFTSDLTHLTGGRLVGTFRYVRDGKAIATVLHAEETSIDFSKPFDPGADAELQKHWRLWMFDLKANTAKQVTGAGNVPQAFMFASFGPRAFLLPYPFTGQQASVMNYEINLDGSVTPRFESPGFTYNWFRVR